MMRKLAPAYMKEAYYSIFLFIENKDNGFVWELKGQIDLSDLRHGT